MTPDEVLIVQALASCSFIPGSSPKRFVRQLAGRDGDRFVGWAPGTPRYKALVRVAIIDAISMQPRTEIQVAVAVHARGIDTEIDAATVGAILKRMEQEHAVVRQRDGSWAVKA